MIMQNPDSLDMWFNCKNEMKAIIENWSRLRQSYHHIPIASTCEMGKVILCSKKCRRKVTQTT